MSYSNDILNGAYKSAVDFYNAQAIQSNWVSDRVADDYAAIQKKLDDIQKATVDTSFPEDMVRYQKSFKRYEVENCFMELRFAVHMLAKEFEKLGPLDMRTVDNEIKHCIEGLRCMVLHYNDLKREEGKGVKK